MKSWDSRPARRDATKVFCEYLDDPAHSAEREQCTDQTPDAARQAKRLFAQLGHFYLEEELPANAPPELKPIPAKTKFLVYESDPHVTRDELVTLVLPPRISENGEAKQPPFEATNVFRCTYWPYVSVE
jgi:hypothetical protein